MARILQLPLPLPVLSLLTFLSIPYAMLSAMVPAVPCHAIQLCKRDKVNQDEGTRQVWRGMGRYIGGFRVFKSAQFRSIESGYREKRW